MIHSTFITEYRNWEDLIRDIHLYNNMVIFSFPCLGKTFDDIIKKIDELRHHNSNLKLYSIMDKCWYEGGQEMLSEIHVSDQRSFEYQVIVSSALIKEKGIIQYMTLMKHFELPFTK